MDALDELAELGESLETLNKRAAEEAGPKLLEAVRKTAGAGQTPEGEAWPPGADGQAVLTGAANAIVMAVVGPQIQLSIGVPYVFHDRGAGDSSESKAAKRASAERARKHAESGTRSKFHAPRRQILPDSHEFPKSFAEALTKAIERAFANRR